MSYTEEDDDELKQDTEQVLYLADSPKDALATQFCEEST